MKNKLLISALTGLILTSSCLVNVATAAVIGNLTHTSGSAVSDSLNNLEWLRFADSRSKMSHSTLQSLFDDPNSDLHGFAFAGIFEADLFLDAAFGAQMNNTAVSHNTYYSGINATLFTSVMGDGYSSNSNNIWRYEVSDVNATYNWTQDVGTNNQVRSQSANFAYSTYDGSMSWLAFKGPVVVSEPSIIALLAFGLAGIGFRRCKK